MRLSSFGCVIAMGGAALVASCGDAEQAAFADDGPVAGCVDGDVAEQRYGTACLCCHKAEFSVAGSIDRGGPAVARVTVTDATGREIEVVPNGFDNFFRHYALTPPLRPVVHGPNGRALVMQSPAPSGDCNGCHRPGGSADRLRGPE